MTKKSALPFLLFLSCLLFISNASAKNYLSEGSSKFQGGFTCTNILFKKGSSKLYKSQSTTLSKNKYSIMKAWSVKPSSKGLRWKATVYLQKKSTLAKMQVLLCAIKKWSGSNASTTSTWSGEVKSGYINLDQKFGDGFQKKLSSIDFAIAVFAKSGSVSARIYSKITKR